MAATENDLPALPLEAHEILASAKNASDEEMPEVFLRVFAQMRTLVAEVGRDRGLQIADQLFDILEHTADEKTRRDLLRRYAIRSEQQLRQMALLFTPFLSLDLAESLSAYALGVPNGD